MTKIYNNVWTSITVFTQKLVEQFQLENPSVKVQYLDWDAHANINELPNADLIGPLAISITENSPDMIEVVFSIAVSTFASDENLFRQRDYVATFFEAMKSQNKIAYYNADLASRVSHLVMTNGTMVAPMSKAELRPWQFVQGQALLLPVEVMTLPPAP